LSKLQKILVRARRQVFSEMVGNNRSIFNGEGYDFIELREYMAGDDIRHIDWNITAKMQKPYIKVFREERELNVAVVSILNGSVYFGSKKFKQDLIAEIMALLSFSTVKNGDLLSSYIFTDRLISYTKPSKKQFWVNKIVDNILSFKPLGEVAEYKKLSDFLFKRLKKRSLVIIVGDFFQIPDFRLLAKKHEVLAVIVRDRLEEKPPQIGFASLMDPETSTAYEGDFNQKTIESYEQKIFAHDKELYFRFRKDRIRFTKIYTDENVGVKLRRLFEGR